MNNRPQELYERIRAVLKGNDINASDSVLIDYGLQFTVSTFDWSGVIRIYQNKKGVVKIDYSQLGVGANATRIKTLIEGDSIATSPDTSNRNNVALEYPLIGTDESGKGDYFGPLVSAGVYVDERSARDLTAYGVKDSKDLADSRILELAPKIVQTCKGYLSVIEISPDRYNDLYEQFTREGKNLNTLLAWGHAKAIEEILSKIDCKIALADQFADESFILSKLQERGRGIRLIQMHKAEQNIAVAAASILARARFLVKLSKLSDEYKIELPKGASQKVVENAKKFIEMHGREKLRNVAKLHFRITKDICKD
jgi:ribonuclease HIII